MGVRILKAKDFSTKLKVTIQATGKLGFTEDTANELGLSDQSYLVLGVDDEDADLMYLVVSDQNDDAFKVCKAGHYFYLPTTRLFQSLGMDFRAKTIMFDLARAEELDGELNGIVYKMYKREKIKDKKEDSTMK